MASKVMASKPPVTAALFCCCCDVLVQQHPDQQGERVAAEELVGRGVLGEGKGRHRDDGA
jgi:hypothetical protein